MSTTTRSMATSVYDAARSSDYTGTRGRVATVQAAMRQAEFTHDHVVAAVDSDRFASVAGFMCDVAGVTFDDFAVFVGAAVTGGTCENDVMSDPYDCPCECYEVGLVRKVGA